MDKNVADRRLLKDHFHKSRVKISAMDSNYYHFFPFFPIISVRQLSSCHSNRTEEPNLLKKKNNNIQSQVDCCNSVT